MVTTILRYFVVMCVCLCVSVVSVVYYLWMVLQITQLQSMLDDELPRLELKKIGTK